MRLSDNSSKIYDSTVSYDEAYHLIFKLINVFQRIDSRRVH